MRRLSMLIFAAAIVGIAGQAMAVDLKAPIKQVDGKAFDLVEGKPVTLGSIAKVALLSTYPDDQQTSGEQKFKRWQLAAKIEAGDGNLSIEEIKLLKDLIGKSFGAPVVGPAWQILDPAGAPK